MKSMQSLPTEDEAFDEWKRALSGGWYEDWIESIEKACRSRDHTELLNVGIPPWIKGRNLLQFAISEADSSDDLEEGIKFIEERFRLPIVQAMVETAPDRESRTKFVNKPNSSGVTPLQIAAWSGHTLIARYLIEQGAQVDSRDDDGTTPLHVAAENFRTDVVELLLEHLQGENRIPYDNEFRTPADTLAGRLNKGDGFGKEMNEAAGRIAKLLSGRQQEAPSTGFTCQIVTLGDRGEGIHKYTKFDKPVSEVLYGSTPVLQMMRDRLLEEDDSETHWQSYGVSLPRNNPEWILRAAKIIFHGEVEGDVESLLDCIKHMAEPGKLRSPGYYPATPLAEHSKSKLDPDRTRKVNAILKDVYCIVLPILEVNSRKRLQEGRYPRPQVKHQSSPVPTSPQPGRSQHPHENKSWDEEILLTDQSLDEYCHDFLKDEALRERDESQVVGRYAKHRKLGSDEIVVVSQLRIWKFGAFFISSYGSDRDSSSSDQQCEHLSHRVFKGDRPLLYATASRRDIALHAIMEACVRYEPRLPRSEGRELLDGGGAFAVEIARESSLVAKYFQSYMEKLGSVDRHYKRSVKEETNTLLRLDDALGELAMIRRVHEDLRLVCLERLNNRSELDRWAERSEIKLRRLEDDATRVRESLVTLLSLKQREVNTENLINSKLQSQILVVFTAATVLFAPLSWMSSLMALNIKSFSPEDTIWSLSAAATASIVTLFGFAGLMLVTLLIWWWLDGRQDRTPEPKEQEKLADSSEVSAQEGHSTPKSTHQPEKTFSGFLFRRRRGGQRPGPPAEV